MVANIQPLCDFNFPGTMFLSKTNGLMCKWLLNGDLLTFCTHVILLYEFFKGIKVIIGGQGLSYFIPTYIPEDIGLYFYFSQVS